MSNLGLGLSAYAQSLESEGFMGQASFAELAQLNKALSAGSTTGRETTNLLTPGSGAPLKVESLEKSLKVLTFKESDIVLWKNIPKLPAFNTVEEYNRLTSYGEERGGAVLEGELPTTEDSTYQRAAQLVKFYGTTREVTHPMTLVRTNVGDMVARETLNGTMWLLRKINRSLVKGDSGIVPAEFDGLYAQHQSGFTSHTSYLADATVIDLRGKVLSEETIEESVRTIVDNFGNADTLFMPPVVLSNFTKFFYPNLRQLAPVPGDTKVGRKITSFQSQFGDVSLNFDKFMNKSVTKTSVTAAQTNAPTKPGAVGAVAATNADSKWAATDAGSYYFAVSAINRFGESDLRVINPGGLTAVAAGESVNYEFTDGGGTYPATGYTLYRSNAGAASVAAAIFYPLFSVSTAQLAAGFNGGAAGHIIDHNAFMPNTDQAFILENQEDIWSFKQLAPLMKMDLAIIAPAIRFMILMYGTPFLYQPRKVVRFINIGTEPNV